MAFDIMYPRFIKRNFTPKDNFIHRFRLRRRLRLPLQVSAVLPSRVLFGSGRIKVGESATVLAGALCVKYILSRSIFGGINLKELAMGLKSPNVSLSQLFKHDS